jgi:hypothetical protein
MAYTQKTKVQYADTSNLDAFGRLRISESNQIWEGKVVNGYDWGPDIVNSADDSGRSYWEYGPNFCDLVMANASAPPSNFCVYRESAYHLPYQSGRSSLCMFTFSGFDTRSAPGSLSKVYKRIGLYHNSSFDIQNQLLDGFFFESYTNQVSFVVSYQGTEIFRLDQSNWENTDFDPSTIDWAVPQIGWIDYEWLGVGRIRFGLVIDGVARKFGEFSLANDPEGTGLLTTTSIRPNQKFRMEMFLAESSNADLEERFRGYCQSFLVEGAMNSISRTYQHYTNGGTATSGVMTGLLGFQVPEGEAGLAYWSFAELDTLSFYTLGASSKPSFLYILYVPHNTTINTNPWISYPNFNLLGATGTTASPLTHSSVASVNLSSIPYQIIGSYPMTEGSSQIVAPTNVLVRPGYTENTRTGLTGNTLKGNIWIAVISASNATSHYISANWKCIT